MAKITPFQGLRPTSDKVSLVTTRSYDDYSTTELAYSLEFNPFSFLHILNPAYANQQKVNIEKRYKAVATKFMDFKKEGIFVKEDNPVFYLYQIESKNHQFTGILAGTAIEDYQNNLIKKHEDTLEYRVHTFKDYLHFTRFNTEPVLLMYPENKALNAWINEFKQKQALYHFTTSNKEKHTLWKIDQVSDQNWLIETFGSIEQLYIADGHHRSASAELLYKQDHASNNPHLDYFMSFLIAENNIKIYEYNRLIHDLNQHSKTDFLQLLNEKFVVKNKKQQLWKPTKKTEFGMYLDGEFYSLQLKSTGNSEGVLNNLDAQVLYTELLHPILGVEDLRTDSRIEYVPGTESIITIKEMVDSGEFEVGFMLYPTNVTEIKELADNNQIMPPKSTYIEPKFRSGLIIYEI
ncbi:DUF1015 domain-containing protein [Flavobacterium sp. NKUCC04_CG]|uniref:DUF1015 domain-containing protein n=1 Tax=Flavobacterium sp. NKUCC04_CG TaxID=2842121 RepID=UPI001C5A9C2F|nr:DUF1015 domain-containing protein [Flavobacterium sp. NKUCC04_CG]MBW3519071.1 DUF1015 domain-containing protein [Flavobacterium sp. NKUCC04_CG]